MWINVMGIWEICVILNMGKCSCLGRGKHVGTVLSYIASSKGDAPRYEIVPVPGVSGKGLFNNMRYKRNTVRSSLQMRTSGAGSSGCHYSCWDMLL